jgi:hypothetical protein
VKRSTLQLVARRLGVHISLFDQSLSGRAVSHGVPNAHPKTELQMRLLDTASLHEMLCRSSMPEDVHWHVDLLSLTQRQEELILEFEKRAGELDKLVNGYDEWGNNKNRSLKGQLTKLRLVSIIEESITALNAEGIGVFGALFDTFLIRDDDVEHFRAYDPMTCCLIGFAADKLKTLTITVTDNSPPTQFDHLYPRIQKVIVDDKVVWETDKPLARHDVSPFEEDTP